MVTGIGPSRENGLAGQSVYDLTILRWTVWNWHNTSDGQGIQEESVMDLAVLLWCQVRPWDDPRDRQDTREEVCLGLCHPLEI